MKPTNIFHSIQKNVNPDKLISIDNLSSCFEDDVCERILVNCDLEYLQEYMDKNNLSMDNFYINPNNVFSLYTYFGELFYMDIPYINRPQNEDEEKFNPLNRLGYLNKVTQELYDEKDFLSLFNMIDKPARIYFLNKLYDEIPFDDRKEILLDIYVMSEYGFKEINPKIMEECVFSSTLSEEEKEQISKNWEVKDNKVKIYRGEQSLSTNYNSAYSWSLNRKVAEMFSKRFKEDRVNILYEAYVDLDDIMVTLLDRGESEVLVEPSKLLDVCLRYHIK